jgi:hypothetical protein
VPGELIGRLRLLEERHQTLPLNLIDDHWSQTLPSGCARVASADLGCAG